MVTRPTWHDGATNGSIFADHGGSMSYVDGYVLPVPKKVYGGFKILVDA